MASLIITRQSNIDKSAYCYINLSLEIQVYILFQTDGDHGTLIELNVEDQHHHLQRLENLRCPVWLSMS